jgi:hypothetical protein
LSRSKSLPVGDIWHPSVMQFYSGPLMHFLSGVDTRGVYFLNDTFNDEVLLHGHPIILGSQ